MEASTLTAVPGRPTGVFSGSLDLLPETDVTAVFDDIHAAGRRLFGRGLGRSAVWRGVLSRDVVVHRAEGNGGGVDGQAGGRAKAAPGHGGLRLSVPLAATCWVLGDPTLDSGGTPAVVASYLPLTVDPDQARHLQQTLPKLAAG